VNSPLQISTSHGPAGSGSAAARGERILLVDDDAMIRRLVRTALELEGYTVLAAAGPLEALALAESELECDLLLTDVQMPDLSGPVLAQRLSGRAPHMRVMFMSSAARVQDVGVPAGAPFLRKPFTLAELNAGVREALGRQS
jgi:DNA-binding response OmpR family regulator